jgi:hypothetical protein
MVSVFAYMNLYVRERERVRTSHVWESNLHRAGHANTVGTSRVHSAVPIKLSSV